MSKVSFGVLYFPSVIHSGLCDSVHEVYLRNATLQTTLGFENVNKPCSSLKVIDFSDSKLPNDVRDIKIGKFLSLYPCVFSAFFFNLEELYINGLGKYLMTPPLQDDHDGNLTSCPYRIKKNQPRK
ncbi:hypothetical protein DPMN_011649 [Dreissena polymorpha]|uniref:Uncharacterized protein n=1 Tax=Dreissena polymorpha TaxID=45954 RepID=A0A9D4N419_DREPO|nr:hypothetical protein DPMN_011649 [Dreissena polymorpha]